MREGQTNEWTAYFLRCPLVRQTVNSTKCSFTFFFFRPFFSLSHPLLFSFYDSIFLYRQCVHHACLDLWLRRQTRVNWRQTCPHRETAHRSYWYRIWTVTFFSFGSQSEQRRWGYAQDSLWTSTPLWYNMVLILTYASLNLDHFKMGDPQESQRRAKANFLEEAELVDEVGEFGHGPPYITHVSQPAGPFHLTQTIICITSLFHACWVRICMIFIWISQMTNLRVINSNRLRIWVHSCPLPSLTQEAVWRRASATAPYSRWLALRQTHVTTMLSLCPSTTLTSYGMMRKITVYVYLALWLSELVV